MTKAEAKASAWALGTFNAVIWAAFFVCFIEDRTPPWWAGLAVMAVAYYVSMAVATRVLKEERAKANGYRS